MVLTCFLRSGDSSKHLWEASANSLSLQQDVTFLRNSPDVSHLSARLVATPARENRPIPKQSKPRTMFLMGKLKSSPM